MITERVLKKIVELVDSASHTAQLSTVSLKDLWSAYEAVQPLSTPESFEVAQGLRELIDLRTAGGEGWYPEYSIFDDDEVFTTTKVTGSGTWAPADTEGTYTEAGSPGAAMSLKLLVNANQQVRRPIIRMSVGDTDNALTITVTAYGPDGGQLGEWSGSGSQDNSSITSIDRIYVDETEGTNAWGHVMEFQTLGPGAYILITASDNLLATITITLSGSVERRWVPTP